MGKSNKKEPPPSRGKNFIRESTGSATKINLDGQWEQDFTDHTEKKGR